MTARRAAASGPAPSRAPRPRAVAPARDAGPSEDARRTRDMARRIIAHHLGAPPKRVTPLAGGLTNFVYDVAHAEGAFVVRLSLDAAKMRDFLKEQWAMARARDLGVPTPEVLEVGCEVVPHPYMIARKAPGHEATHNPARFAVLREMGRLTALVHTVRTSGFGATFDWSPNRLSRNETWRDYLRDELRAEERLGTLEARGMLSAPQLRSLRAALAEAEGWTQPPALNHGDMRLKNVLADEEGAVTAVIDWEHCVSSIAPSWDLALALHDLSIDAKGEFLAGYGLSGARLRELAPGLKLLNLLHYAPVVERLAAAGDVAGLDAHRARLRGDLDLFSL